MPPNFHMPQHQKLFVDKRPQFLSLILEKFLDGDTMGMDNLALEIIPIN